MVRRFVKDRNVLLRSLGALGVGSVGVYSYYEYQTFSDDFGYSYTSMETGGLHHQPRQLPIQTRIKYHISDFAARYGIPLANGNERLLSKLNSPNKKDRNDAIDFLSKGTDWLDGPDGLPEKERAHVESRIRQSKIIPGLARLSKFEEKFFVDPPELPESSRLMSDRLLEIFDVLPNNEVIENENLFTPCVKHFTQQAMAELEKIRNRKTMEREDPYDDDFVTAPLKLDMTEEPAELMLLKALRRHADIREHMARVPPDQLFRLLYRFLSWNPKEPSLAPEAREIALRTIANLALNPRYQTKFVDWGFHKVLRKFADMNPTDADSTEMATDNLETRFQAIRALANLDQDDPNSYRYDDGVFLIHPPYRTAVPPKYDVVFIHGLGGRVATTWTTTDTQYCSRGNESNKKINWLDRWVARDLQRNPKNVRILGIDYETAILFWNHDCPFGSDQRTLQDRAKSVGTKLQEAGVGERPTVFVCYSMGGLVLKKILDLYPHMGKKTKGIVFLATPHHGSPTAELSNEETWGYLSKMVRTFVTPEVLLLGGSDEDLEELNARFISLVRRENIKVLSWGEELKSDWGIHVHIVPLENANPNVGEFRTSKKDHDGMVMPIDEVDPIYSQNLTFIRECFQS